MLWNMYSGALFFVFLGATRRKSSFFLPQDSLPTFQCWLFLKSSENILFSLFVKVFVLMSAAFFPEFTKMWEGVFADVGVSLIAVINSMRALNISKRKIVKLLFNRK